MRHTAILGVLGIVALLAAASTVEARPVNPHHKTMKRVKPVAARTPTPVGDYPVIRRHKCIVGCG